MLMRSRARAPQEFVLHWPTHFYPLPPERTMMTRRWMLIITGVLLALPTAGAAQGGAIQSWQAQTVADVEQMRDKFLSLAEAFPEETWDWAPMEGVRSVRDVMVLIVTEGTSFPGCGARIHRRVPPRVSAPRPPEWPLCRRQASSKR